MSRRPDRGRRWLAGIAACTFALAACGSSDSSTSDSSSSADAVEASEAERTVAERIADGVLSGVVREPFPDVSGNPLPSLTNPGTEVEFVAQPGEVQVIYFGFTNCPDICPTTLVDLTVALRLLDVEQPGARDRVETVMVTVDPARDLEILPDYVTSFISNAEAVGTPDEQALLDAAAPFGASFDVRTLDDGTIEVDHSPFLYAVDEHGELLLSWQFGATKEDMAADLAIMLQGATA